VNFHYVLKSRVFHSLSSFFGPGNSYYPHFVFLWFYFQPLLLVKVNTFQPRKASTEQSCEPLFHSPLSLARRCSKFLTFIPLHMWQLIQINLLLMPWLTPQGSFGVVRGKERQSHQQTLHWAFNNLNFHLSI
jgi:hypothetical protein